MAGGRTFAMRITRFDQGSRFDDQTNRWHTPASQLKPGDRGHLPAAPPTPNPQRFKMPKSHDLSKNVNAFSSLEILETRIAPASTLVVDLGSLNGDDGFKATGAGVDQTGTSVRSLSDLGD